MADVRALLAAERQSRRISHPHLSYTKSGMLICTICNLNVKSEALWEGHLRSANHRKNVIASQETTSKPLKRKIEDVEATPKDSDEADNDARKKPKSRPESMANSVLEAAVEPAQVSREDVTEDAPAEIPRSNDPTIESEAQTTRAHAGAPTNADGTTADPDVDEDEWAAFERDIAPLTVKPPDYAAATISAAPVSADQLADQAADDKRRTLDTEAQDEQDDEARRLEDEFDVMEEMEERVRRLREKREALRTATKAEENTGQPEATEAEAAVSSKNQQVNAVNRRNEDEDDVDNDDDEEEDWYR